MEFDTVESDFDQPRSIWEELEEWAKGFSIWQRLLLTDAIRLGTIPDGTIKTAFCAFLVQHDLADPSTAAIASPASVTGRQRNAPGKVLLSRIFAPLGVNRLPEAAELTFSSGLTVIYGGNGVGKSGFARILSNACFSRQHHPIYPDAFDESAPRTPSASIEVVASDGTKSVLNFDNVTQHPELKRGFVVFDSAVAARHIVDTGPLGFTPTGFDVFVEMARAYAQLRAMLQAEIKARPQENRFGKAFIGRPSEASQAASSLSAASNIPALRALAHFGVDEAARLSELQQQGDHLRTKSPAGEISRLMEVRPLVERLKLQFSRIALALSVSAIEEDQELSRALARATTDALAESSERFSHPNLVGVGGVRWSSMIEAAHLLIKEQHDHYPSSEGDVCLLCQQLLQPAAKNLFERYESFASGTSRRKLGEVQASIGQRMSALQRLDLDLLEAGSIVVSFLGRSNPEALSILERQLILAKSIRAALLAAFEGEGWWPDAPTPLAHGEGFDAILQQIDLDLERLRREDISAALSDIETERQNLRHRQVLSQNLQDMEVFIADQRWIEKAEASKSELNPRHLTEKESELFNTVIAANYRATLAQECHALNCAVPIEMRTQGQKGQTVRSLRVAEYSPDDILSEGEQRAVAMADFLTEVSLNADNVGIILDDPVTSLDHERKERIAQRLVSEATKRQVIIFTHDLLFFAKIGEAAAVASITPTFHWMQRSPDDAPGVVSLNDAPTTTPAYRNTVLAEELLAKAKLAVGSEQEDLLRRSAGKLRRTIEEIVPHYLFKEVVRRWTDRLMITALKKINWDNELVDEIVDIFEACSEVIEGHSHTEGGVETRPSITKVESLIARTKTVIAKAKPQRND